MNADLRVLRDVAHSHGWSVAAGDSYLTATRRGVRVSVLALDLPRTPFAYARVQGLPLMNLWPAPTADALYQFLATAPVSLRKDLP